MADNPFGLHRVTPYLVVADARRLIAFAQTVFGAALRGHPHYREDGGIEHAEIEIGDSVIMIGEPPDGTPQPATLYIYVEDCGAAFAAAQKAGAAVLQEPKDYPHGDRLAGVKDPTGIGWWLAEHLAAAEAR